MSTVNWENHLWPYKVFVDYIPYAVLYIPVKYIYDLFILWQGSLYLLIPFTYFAPPFCQATTG